MEPPPSARQRPADELPASSTDDEGARWRRERLERFAYLLDDAFRVPGTKRRVGLDALIGLLPGVGDAAGALLSSYILYEGVRLRVSIATLARMALNIGIEMIVGLVPILGDLFDFAFKANNRNVRLIERHLDDPQATRRSSRTVLTAIALALLLLIASLFAGSIWLVSALIEALGGAA